MGRVLSFVSVYVCPCVVVYATQMQECKKGSKQAVHPPIPASPNACQPAPDLEQNKRKLQRWW